MQGAWEIEGERRNAGIDACRGRWILEVDCDERVPAALAGEIRAAIAAPADGYFLVPMANHIGARLVRHGWGAYNGVAAKPALFERGSKRWGRGRVHPKIDLSGPRGRLTQAMDHYVYRDISDMIRRLDRYTDLAARTRWSRARRRASAPPCGASSAAPGKAMSRAAAIARARGAWRLALMSAIYPLLIYLKVATRSLNPLPRGEGRVRWQATRAAGGRPVPLSEWLYRRFLLEISRPLSQHRACSCATGGGKASTTSPARAWATGGIFERSWAQLRTSPRRRFTG